MDRSTGYVLCIIVVALVGLAFILDLLAVAWAMIRKKPYKSAIGGFVESFLEHPKLFWLPVIIAAMYAFGFCSMKF